MGLVCIITRNYNCCGWQYNPGSPGMTPVQIQSWFLQVVSSVYRDQGIVGAGIAGAGVGVTGSYTTSSKLEEYSDEDWNWPQLPKPDTGIIFNIIDELLILLWIWFP